MATWWRSYIAQRARQYGLDPQAVLAVASQEGLSGGVGDGGHAFGPFQMNDAGGVLTGRPGNHRAYAESRQGIDAALRAMSGVARGLHGRSAIQAIVSRYERPANPRKEIAGALSAYGGGSSGAPLALSMASPTRQASSGPDSASLRANVLSSLIAASQETGHHQSPDYSSLFSSLAALRQGQQSAPAHLPSSKSSGGAMFSRGGSVQFSGDVGGLNASFASKLHAALASIGATRVEISDGRRPRNAGYGATDSNHIYGRAADGKAYIPGRGWVPLGTALAGVAPRYGLRSGTTFNWGGRPDVVHVDDGYNQHHRR